MKKPDFRLKFLNKVTDQKNNNAGAAWLNDNGSISIVLNLGISITDNKDFVINLFPIDEKYK